MHSQSISWLVEFSHRYDRARLEREPRTKRTNVELDLTNPFHARALDESVLRRKRIDEGYRLPFEREIAGRIRKPFVEHGLRSINNPVLKLFIARLPKGGHLRASDNKADLYVPFWSKLLTLDCPYIEGSRTSMSMIRLDVDAVFASADACVAALESKVADGSIPHLPHIIVGDTLDNGQFSGAHLIYMLKHAVWNDQKDERCRSAPINLFKIVYRGFLNALLDIGVDPAAPAMTMRTKNPLSPIWTTITPNSEHFSSLREYSEVLDTTVSRQKLTRVAAEIQSGLGKGLSNELFNSLTDHCSKLLKTWHINADVRLKLGKDDLAEILFEELAKRITDISIKPKQASYVCAKVAQFMASTFDPSKINIAKNRGRLAHVVSEGSTRQERQQAGARHAQETRASKTRETLKAAVIKLKSDGRIDGMSKERIAIYAKVSRDTVYRHLASVLQEIEDEKVLERSSETFEDHKATDVTVNEIRMESTYEIDEDEDESCEHDENLYRRIESGDEMNHYIEYEFGSPTWI